MLKEIRLYGTTNGSGALTVNADKPVIGRLYAVRWLDTALDACTATISTQGHDASATLLTLTAVNATATYYPRDLVHDATGSALTGTSGGDRCLPLMVGVPRLVIASGGDSNLGGCILFYFED